MQRGVTTHVAERLYNWKRFWYPTGAELSPLAGPFLPDPADEFGLFANPEFVPFERLSDVPCLALIGEPGIGKSIEMERECETAAQALSAGGDRARLFNLREYGDDTALCRNVFQDAALQEWLRGAHRLHLFLDSLDEGRLSIPAGLRSSIVEIACRRFQNTSTQRRTVRGIFPITW